MSEYASKRNRGKMVGLVFSAQGAGLVIGPLVAIGLLSTGLSSDYVWRILLALGAVPALAVFWLRRRIKETPRLPTVGLSKTCSLVAGVSVLGLLATLILLPEPKGSSLEDFTEQRYPTSAVALGVAESRGTRAPSG